MCPSHLGVSTTVHIHQNRQNQDLVQQVVDDASSLRASRAASTANSRATRSIVSDGNSTVDSRSYILDAEIVESPAYQRMQPYRLAMSYDRPRHEMYDRLVKVNESYETKSTNNTSEFSPARSSIDPFETSNPVDSVYMSRDPAYRSAYVLPVMLGSNFHSVHVGPQGNGPGKSSWPSFLRFKKRCETSPLRTGSISQSSKSRHVRRGFENKFQSIDFSSPDSLTVQPIVRAAHAGSMVEWLRWKSYSTATLTLRSAMPQATGMPGQLQRTVAKMTLLNTLTSAASRGHCESMKLLLRDGAPIEQKDDEGRTPLWLASGNGQLDAAEILLKDKAKVNTRAKDQLTPLHVAAERGDALMAGLLIHHCAQVDAKDGYFMAALHYDCEGGHGNVVEILLNKNGDVEACGRYGGMTALHWASQYGYAEVVDLLIRRKMSIDTINANGHTPLHLIIMSQKFDVVELLLRRKAELEPRCNRSFTALHYGCASGSTEIVQILFGSGAELEAITSDGRPLHIAVKHGVLPTVELLLSRGADQEARDSAGDRALTVACFHGHSCNRQSSPRCRLSVTFEIPQQRSKP
ncbi:MAG: hypothetical protein M1813_000841 [Trichoglossum hirsutum]|nr:MAG: hypothetical protein M1813_000841 [Trichoglossum hirsutum]